MTVVLLFVAVALVLSVWLGRVSSRLGVPLLLVFIVLGLIVGRSGVSVPFATRDTAAPLCQVALIVILFYGGFGTNWHEAKTVAIKAFTLASLGVVMTAAVTGFCVHLLLGFDWVEAMLLGGVIASTDAASVFSLLRAHRLSLKQATDSLLEVESGANDPAAYTLTIVFIAVASRGMAWGGALMVAVLQMAGGLLVGVVLAWIVRRQLSTTLDVKGGASEVFMIAIALLAYALAEAIGGNGYLSVYVVGLILGEVAFDGEARLVAFFDGLTYFAQIAIFFTLGLLADLNAVLSVLPIALLVWCLVTCLARPLAVFALLRGWRRAAWRQPLVVSWAGIRGAASVVFAIMAVNGAPWPHDLYHIVFTVVLLSLLIQGVTLPWVARKADLFDPAKDVMKTFNDYIDETRIQFVTTQITSHHPWRGQTLSALNLPSDLRVVAIDRGGRIVAPSGATMVATGDRVVLSGHRYDDLEDAFRLRERRVVAGDRFANRPIRDIKGLGATTILLIERDTQLLIPSGETVVLPGDTLVLNRPHERGHARVGRDGEGAM